MTFSCKIIQKREDFSLELWTKNEIFYNCRYNTYGRIPIQKYGSIRIRNPVYLGHLTTSLEKWYPSRIRNFPVRTVEIKTWRAPGNTPDATRVSRQQTLLNKLHLGFLSQVQLRLSRCFATLKQVSSLWSVHFLRFSVKQYNKSLLILTAV